MMPTSYYLAKEFYDKMKYQDLDYLRRQGFHTQKIRQPCVPIHHTCSIEYSLFLRCPLWSLTFI
eukprot:2613251-Amphidinium_carterae.2